jgi:hypothetical protein
MWLRTGAHFVRIAPDAGLVQTSAASRRNVMQTDEDRGKDSLQSSMEHAAAERATTTTFAA